MVSHYFYSFNETMRHNRAQENIERDKLNEIILNIVLWYSILLPPNPLKKTPIAFVPWTQHYFRLALFSRV